jgi:hypothetical protein
MTAPDHGFVRSGILALLLAIFGSASMAYYYVGLLMPRWREAHAAMNLAGGYAFGRDFYPVWLTSHSCIRQGCDPYSPEMTREIQRGLFGRTLDSQIPSDPPADYRTFAYPAFTDLLLWPFGEFPFATVQVIFALLLAALTVVSVWVWMQALSWRPSAPLLLATMLLVLCSYPVLQGLYAEQLGLLVGFFLAISVFALQRGWALPAGILMALTTIKPQMTILAMFYLVVWSFHDWQKRGRFCIGLFSTMLFLIGAALLVWPHWIQSWVRVLLGYHHYAKPPLISAILGAPLGRSGLASAGAIALLLILSATVSWKNRTIPNSSVKFWLTLSFSLCITAVTLLPSQGFHDQVILLPGLFLVSHHWEDLSRGRISKVLLATGAGILLWPWLAATGLLAIRPLLTQQEFYSKSIIILPLPAAAFPFVLLAVLALGLGARSAVLTRA